ncbi:FadR/GntR family transcriptional regulator [Rhodococcus opacus]|uniref:FadR/GntR family transcriptional regulator n=1 Tax=Rhodococcus opacus TaxID=37919 RepID=UPI0015FC4B7C|nr:FCD domain-containing protein [Rhodococcus opacus]MBA8959056.1 DNA-binding FadR family transcriptional regulator [Rhodococcus opacus]MBP2204621.1 DNA-binding FadR family transcriptional regulator [Rhodococcus opacus]UZG57175.1 FCD domain-containing protein [Rhodococcus opacus]
MTSSIRRHLLTDQAADLLRSRIESGEWEVGAKLPGETTLAAELGVGRSTVREAIRMLAGLGMLESRQGAGVFLRGSSPRQGWDRVLRTEEIRHVVEVRNTVEIEAARLAAARRGEDDVAALRQALDARSAASGTGAAAFVDADIALHRAVVVAARNPVLTELFETFVPRLREAMLDLMDVLDLTAHSEPDADDHRLLVEAIADGDAEQAVRIMRLRRL